MEKLFCNFIGKVLSNISFKIATTVLKIGTNLVNRKKWLQNFPKSKHANVLKQTYIFLRLFYNYSTYNPSIVVFLHIRNILFK